MIEPVLTPYFCIFKLFIICNHLPVPLAWCYPGLTETYPPFSFAATIVGELSLLTTGGGVENTEKHKQKPITSWSNVHRRRNKTASLSANNETYVAKIIG